MGQSQSDFYYADRDCDVTVERLGCDATTTVCSLYSLSLPPETKNFPIFYSFLSIQMLPYIIFLCKFVQLVDRYFSLVLQGGPATTAPLN